MGAGARVALGAASSAEVRAVSNTPLATAEVFRNSRRVVMRSPMGVERRSIVARVARRVYMAGANRARRGVRRAARPDRWNTRARDQDGRGLSGRQPPTRAIRHQNNACTIKPARPLQRCRCETVYAIRPYTPSTARSTALAAARMEYLDVLCTVGREPFARQGCGTSRWVVAKPRRLRSARRGRSRSGHGCARDSRRAKGEHAPGKRIGDDRGLVSVDHEPVGAPDECRVGFAQHNGPKLGHAGEVRGRLRRGPFLGDGRGGRCGSRL